MSVLHLRSRILTYIVSTFCVLISGNVLHAQDADAAKAIATGVNDALSRYIAVHDDLFAALPRRIAPVPGIFEAVDFRARADTLGAVRETLDSLGARTRSYLNSGEAAGSVHSFLAALQDYVLALDTAVAELRQIAMRLHLKSEDRSVYSWDQYDADVKRYQAAAERYAEH